MIEAGTKWAGAGNYWEASGQVAHGYQVFYEKRPDGMSTGNKKLDVGHAELEQFAVGRAMREAIVEQKAGLMLATLETMYRAATGPGELSKARTAAHLADVLRDVRGLGEEWGVKTISAVYQERT